MLKKIITLCAGVVLSSGIALADFDGGYSGPQGGQNYSVNAGQTQFETRQGRCMQCDVPAGWSFSDGSNGVDSMAPDGITWMSRTYLHGAGPCTPDMLLQRSSRGWTNLGMSNVRVVSSKDVGPQSRLYELEYVFRGRPAHALVQATVQRGYGQGYMANMITLQSSQEAFGQNLPMLIAMAKSVRVSDPNSFCDGGKMDQLAKQRIAIANKSAKEVGDIIINGQNARNAVQAQTNKGAGDTNRSVTRFKDAGGNEYTGPLQAVRAFKFADGTVTFTSDSTMAVPYGATELTPYDYSGR